MIRLNMNLLFLKDEDGRRTMVNLEKKIIKDENDVYNFV